MLLLLCLLNLNLSVGGSVGKIRFEDLPSPYFIYHFVPKNNKVPVSNISHTQLHLDRCGKYSGSCFKCLDHSECGWCVDRRSHNGKCVSLINTESICSRDGGEMLDSCPFFTLDLLLSTVLVALCTLLAAGGGTGGGALFIPIYLLIYKMNAHGAIPLSKVTIFGLAVGGYLVLSRKRHPLKDMSLIDYDLGLLMVMLLLFSKKNFCSLFSS